MAVAGLEQCLLLVRAQTAVPALGRCGFADIANGVIEQLPASFLDSDGEQVREQGELQPDGAGGLAGSQPLVAIFGHKARHDGVQAVGAELLFQRLGLVALRIGGAFPFAGGHLAQVPVQRT